VRIAIFSDNFYPELSGISDAIISLAKELVKRGHVINFYAPRYSKKNYELIGRKPAELNLGKNVKITRFFSFPFPTPTKQGRGVIPTGLGSLAVKKFNPDILHTQLFFGVGVEALIASKLLKKPIIGTNHTVVREFLRYSPVKNPSFLKLVPKYVNWFYERCELTTAPSQFLIKEMEELGFRGKSVVVHNPLDIKFFKPFGGRNNSPLKKKFGLRYPTIVYAGRFAAEKNIDVLLKAFAIVQKQIPEATLALAGHGDTQAALEELARKLNLTKNVKFVGTLSKPKLAKLYHASEICATASTSEVQSITMLEAMASGLPVVGVNARGLAEHINVQNGLLAEPGDPDDLAKNMLRLLKRPLLRKKLGMGAVKFAGNFSAPKIAAEWERIYANVIKNYNENKLRHPSP
jgi:1,2-diacylglycerol 3-alpha-glucosyltransferase